jgi:hypothetical protein
MPHKLHVHELSGEPQGASYEEERLRMLSEAKASAADYAERFKLRHISNPTSPESMSFLKLSYLYGDIAAGKMLVDPVLIGDREPREYYSALEKQAALSFITPDGLGSSKAVLQQAIRMRTTQPNVELALIESEANSLSARIAKIRLLEAVNQTTGYDTYWQREAFYHEAMSSALLDYANGNTLRTVIEPAGGELNAETYMLKVIQNEHRLAA